MLQRHLAVMRRRVARTPLLQSNSSWVQERIAAAQPQFGSHNTAEGSTGLQQSKRWDGDGHCSYQMMQ